MKSVLLLGALMIVVTALPCQRTLSPFGRAEAKPTSRDLLHLDVYASEDGR